MLPWNKPLWLVKNSQGTWISQSECFISAYHSYATLKFREDIAPEGRKFWSNQTEHNFKLEILFIELGSEGLNNLGCDRKKCIPTL